MRVLVCCALPAYPPVGGAPLRIWGTIQWLQKFAEVGVFSLAGSGPPPPGIAESAWCGVGSAARMETSSDWMRRPNGMPSDGFYEEAAVAALQRFVATFRPDIVILETFWLHRYYDAIRECGAHAILNAHNVEVDVACQLEQIEPPSPVKLQRRILVQRLRRAEEALLRGMDQIWVCSEEDAAIMRREYAITVPIHFVPNAVNPQEYEVPCEPPPELAGKSGPVLVFPALFHYPPNLHAAEFLIHQVLPRIAARYENTKVLLPGASPPPELLAEARDPRVIVPGLVPDMLPYIRHSSVLVVPLTHGGGTRFKIIEAFAARVPVVSSAKGAEGLGAIPGKHYLLAETAEEFESAVLRVLDDTVFAAEMVQQAAAFAQRDLWECAGAAMRASIDQVGIV